MHGRGHQGLLGNSIPLYVAMLLCSADPALCVDNDASPALKHFNGWSCGTASAHVKRVLDMWVRMLDAGLYTRRGKPEPDRLEASSSSPARWWESMRSQTSSDTAACPATLRFTLRRCQSVLKWSLCSCMLAKGLSRTPTPQVRHVACPSAGSESASSRLLRGSVEASGCSSTFFTLQNRASLLQGEPTR
jgi:hypothetical protein